MGRLEGKSSFNQFKKIIVQMGFNKFSNTCLNVSDYTVWCIYSICDPPKKLLN